MCLDKSGQLIANILWCNGGRKGRIRQGDPPVAYFRCSRCNLEVECGICKRTKDESEQVGEIHAFVGKFKDGKNMEGHIDVVYDSYLLWLAGSLTGSPILLVNTIFNGDMYYV